MAILHKLIVVKLKSVRFYQFRIAYNTNQFTLRLCTIVEYIIGYLKNLISDFFEILNINLKCSKIKRYM
jgi:hypothetical protein